MSYTNPNASATYTLTAGGLTNSTIADTNLIGADTYAKTLYLSGAAVTADALTVASGGVLHLREGAVGDLLLSGGAAELRASHGSIETLSVALGTLYIAGDVEIGTVNFGKSASHAHTVYFSGGVINGGIVQGDPVFSFSAGQATGKSGGVINNVTFTSGTYLFISAGYFYNCTIENKCGPWRVAGANTVVSSMTILQKEATSTQRGQSAGLMKDCLISNGGFMRQQGGSNVNLTIANGSLTLSGGMLITPTLSAGKINVLNGYVSGAKISAGTLNLLNGNTVRAIYDIEVTKNEAGDRGYLYVYSNGIVSGGSASGGLVGIYSGGTVSGFTFGADTYTNMHGGYICGGSAVGGGQIRLHSDGLNVISGATFNGANLQDFSYSEAEGVGGSAVDLKFANNATYNHGHTWSGTFYSGGYASNLTFESGAKLIMSHGNLVRDVHFTANAYMTMADGVVSGADFKSGAYLNMSGGELNDVTVGSGTVYMSGGKVERLKTEDGVVNVVYTSSGGTITGSSLQYSGAKLLVSGGEIAGAVVNSGASLSLTGGTVRDTIFNGYCARVVQTGGSQIDNTGRGYVLWDTRKGLNEGMVIVGSGTSGELVASVWVSNGGMISSAYLEKTMAAFRQGGVVKDTVFGANTWINMYQGVQVSDCQAISGASLRLRGGTFTESLIRDNSFMDVYSGTADGLTFQDGTLLRISNSGTVRNTTLDGGNLCVSSGATVSNTTVSNGGFMYVQSNGKDMKIEGATVRSGGSISFYTSGTQVTGLTADAGATVIINVLGTTANTPAAIDSLANVAEITVSNATLGTTYTLAGTGNANLKANVEYQGFKTSVTAGESYINPLYGGRKFTINADGTTFEVEENDIRSSIRTTEAADLIQSGATINNGDRALLWEEVNLAAGSAVTFADANIAGDAWLDLDRTNMATGATLYGAAGNYDGTIRYLVHGAGTLGNFAAGAAAGGKVGGVELVAHNNNFGLTYLGGFGDVTDHVSAIVSSGNTLTKDFYAGALANYAKTGSATSIGDIDTTIEMRTDNTRTTDRVKGNIYGASAVKVGTLNTSVTAPIHQVGDVSITLAGGTAADSKFCLFAGGYATGTDSEKTAAVYTVESVTATVSGGSWGSANGGRGIFGGAFASGVKAEVGDINLTVSDGTMGNVYGGGWSQKDGLSVVGDVNLAITGGTVANVFGGGTHSTSGGATEAGKVTITVSDGTISGNIYARGQLAGDTVASAEVIFTGGKNFSCGVYGYSYVGGDDSDATLNFSTYTGKFSGAIGGFRSVGLTANTAMTLSTAAADVSNGDWVFDLTERRLFFDDQAILNWSAADFTEDTVTLKVASSRSQCWTLVSGADASAYNTAAGKFLVEVDGGDAVALTFDAETGRTGTLADGAYAGWGFAVEDSVLKFTKLA